MPRGWRSCVTHAQTRMSRFFKQWGGRTPKAGGRDLEDRTWDTLPLARPRWPIRSSDRGNQLRCDGGCVDGGTAVGFWTETSWTYCRRTCRLSPLRARERQARSTWTCSPARRRISARTPAGRSKSVCCALCKPRHRKSEPTFHKITDPGKTDMWVSPGGLGSCWVCRCGPTLGERFLD